MILANSVKDWFPQMRAVTPLRMKKEQKSGYWLTCDVSTGCPNG
jgi:hypothetical protein